MTLLVPFSKEFEAPAAALWRALHPDWSWLADAEMVAKSFEIDDTRAGYVVQRDGAVIATVFGSLPLDPAWPRNRYINLEARPEDIAADWVTEVLAVLTAADRERPDTWQVASPPPPLWPTLVPLLEAAGFALRSSTMAMEWEGDAVTVVDPSPARFERYAGGNPELDLAIVELHNRSYRANRLTPPANLEYMWKPWPGLTAREYVLAFDAARLVGYAEWFVADDKPYINSFVAARSHWGTPVGAAVGTKAMEILVGLGHRKLHSTVVSTNAPSMKLHLKHGWHVASEQSRSYVRRFDAPGAQPNNGAEPTK